MRLVYLITGLVLSVQCGPTLAETPEVALRTMIERDMAGDPSGRMSLAAANASIFVPASRQIERARIAFELDADAIELATNWRLDEHARKCAPSECSIRVIYRVVGTTVGNGVPSWDRSQGREIRPLPKAVERLVQYKLVNVNGAWRIVKFPPPFVSPKVLADFFKRELERGDSTLASAVVDARAMRNREVVKAWRQRQLATLEGLPH